MKNMKFRIIDFKHSDRVQREGRRLGFYFNGYTDSRHQDKPFIFFNWEDMSITWDDNELRFEDDPATETTLEELKAM